MDVFRVVGIAAAAAILARTVRSSRPELGLEIAVAGGAVMLSLCLSELTGITSAIKESLIGFGIDEAAFTPVFKVVGIACVSQIGADLCRDSGESALASKTEICGRILMASAALPTFVRLMSMLVGLIDEYV